MSQLPHDVDYTVRSDSIDGASFASSRTLRYVPRRESYEMTSEESSGHLGAGFLSRLHRGEGEMDVASLPSLMIEDEPVFLDSTGRMSFIFEMVGDSTLGGEAVRIVSFERLPDEDRGRPLDSGRLLIEPESQALVGIDLDVSQRTLFYEEDARRQLMLEKHEGDVWLPSTARVDSRIKNFLAPSRRISAEWTFRIGDSPDR